MIRAGATPISVASLLLLLAPIGPGATAQESEAVDRWRTELELGFNGSSGNSSFSILRTGAKLTFLETEKAEFEASVLVRYGKNEEDVIADDQRAAMKLDLWPQARVSPFMFADASRDEIRNLDAKVSGGAGGKLSLWVNEQGRASVSAAALVDYERFSLQPGSSARDAETRGRLSIRFRLDHALSSNARFSHTSHYRPVWNQSSDYVVTVTNSLTTTIMGNLALAVEHEYLHDEVPPPGAEPNDQKFAVTLKVTL